MTFPLKYPSIPIAQLVVRLCAHFEVQHVVICSGSRNTPLTNGFLANPYFECYSIIDERAAAFFALGMAQQLKKPVAIVCTSGSALLNFYPAIAEAFYSDIPIVALSADRMPHRIDIGDGQTIRQNGVFEPHLVAAANLKPDVIHATPTILQNPMQNIIPQNASKSKIQEIQTATESYNLEEIIRVLRTATQMKGPVHLNIPMEEPLYEMTKKGLSIEVPPQKIQLEDETKKLQEIKKIWHKEPRKWIIMGVMAPDAISDEGLKLICEDPSVVVLTETTSNNSHPKAIHSIDTLMAPLELMQFELADKVKPDLIITFGGMIVSKKVKQFLRTYSPESHWHIDNKKAYNTFYCLKEHVKMHPDAFILELYKNASHQPSDFHAEVNEIYSQFKRRGRSYLDNIPFSDLKVFDFIAQTIEGTYQIQIANSSAIRYSQLMDWSPKTHFYCNRGTSGIDGSTATAIGAAQITTMPTLLITGDLSFFYDVNGLWNDYIPPSFRILLINNQGGGIFRILPGEKDSPNYDRYFETIHQREAKNIAKAFGFKYTKASYMWSLKRKFKRFLQNSSQPKILEVQTPRKINDRILLDYFIAMKKVYS